MDLPSEQLPFDQIRWPPGRSTSVETGPSGHMVLDTNPRMSSELLRTWLLRRSLEATLTNSPQGASDLRGSLSPPRSLDDSPVLRPRSVESTDVSPRMTSIDVDWRNSFPMRSPSPRLSTRNSPLSGGTILEIPSEYYHPRYSPLLAQSSDSLPSFPFGSPLVDPSVTESSDGSEHRPYFDFSTYESTSQQSPVTAPISTHSSPRPTLQTHPTSYAALSQAMHRRRGQANRETHPGRHVSDAFTFGEPSSNREASNNITSVDYPKWSPVPSFRTLVEEPESLPSSSSNQNQD
jgi:hypothetical protein